MQHWQVLKSQSKNFSCLCSVWLIKDTHFARKCEHNCLKSYIRLWNTSVIDISEWVSQCLVLGFHGFCWTAAVWAGSERVGWRIIFTRRDEDNSDVWSRWGGLTSRAGCCQAGSGLWGWCQACHSTALTAAGWCQRRPPLYSASADAIINAGVAAQASVSCFCSSHKYFHGQQPAIVRQSCCLYWSAPLRKVWFLPLNLTLSILYI